MHQALMKNFLWSIHSEVKPLLVPTLAEAVHGVEILVAAEEEKEAMLSFLMDLASMESPSDVPESQLPVQE